MKTKAPPPVSHLDGKSTHPLIRAWFEMAQLKQLYRQGWLRVGVPEAQCESVAEHSLGVAFLTLLLADQLIEGVDAPRALRMALLHDLGEARVGDLTPHHGVSPEEKHQRERAAVREILGGLPRGDEYVALLDDYDRGESAEAKLVRQLDRLEMALQACAYEHQTGIDLGQFFDSARKVFEHPAVTQTAEELERLRPGRR